MPLGDTIVALATPPGESAIAMIRLSGCLCLSLVNAIFRREKDPVWRYAYYGRYRDIEDRVLDEVVYVLYASGASYTGEAMVEITCHGNPLISQLMIKDLLARGCRLAEPGEFTRTAFLNNKIDLSQAEAVADMIHAKNQLALDSARRQLGGELSKRIHAYMGEIVAIMAIVEAYIDFPEEDLPKEDVQGPSRRLKELMLLVEGMYSSYEYKSVIRDGIRVVVLGAPNAGKSSFFNYLIDEERSIVSPIPGTTRDFVTEKIVLGSLCIELMDTAGLRDTEDAIEMQGVRKAKQKIEEADFYIWVIDGSEEPVMLEDAVMVSLSSHNTLIIENKSDLPRCEAMNDFCAEYPRVRISLKNMEGVDRIRETIVNILKREEFLPKEDMIVVNARHARALMMALESLSKAFGGIECRLPSELVASELRLALDYLGEIVGKMDNESMLDQLFSTFCIGK